jgi:hypothetical protein
MTTAPRPVLSLVASNPDLPRVQDRRQPVQKSFDKVFDPYRFRAEFTDLWSGYLRDSFRNVEAVAVAFDVTFQTACNWWNGTHRPSGDKVALAALRDPQRFAASMLPIKRAA